jgi:hypothetical protein
MTEGQVIKKIYLRFLLFESSEKSLKTKLFLLEVLIDHLIVYIFIVVFFYTQVYYQTNYAMGFIALTYFGCKAESSSGSHRSWRPLQRPMQVDKYKWKISVGISVNPYLQRIIKILLKL